MSDEDLDRTTDLNGDYVLSEPQVSPFNLTIMTDPTRASALTDEQRAREEALFSARAVLGERKSESPGFGRSGATLPAPVTDLILLANYILTGSPAFTGEES